MKPPPRPTLGKSTESHDTGRGRHRRPVVDPKSVDLDKDSPHRPRDRAAATDTANSETSQQKTKSKKLTPAQLDKQERDEKKAIKKTQKRAAKANREAVKAAQKVSQRKHHPNASPADGSRYEASSPWDSLRVASVDNTLLDRLEEQEFIRRHRLRLRISSLIGVLAGVLIVLYVVFFSPLFTYQLAQCHVTGARNVDIKQVCQATQSFEGRSITSLATAGVAKTVLQEVSALKDAQVKPAWPHGLEIHVVERVPVATVRENGKVVGVDRSGVILEIAPGDVAGLPQLDVDMEKLGGQTRKLVDASLIAFGDMPEDLRSMIASVTSDDPAQLQFKLRDGRALVWGNSRDSVEKAQVAKLLFTVQGVKVVDVSNPERPSTR